MTRLTVGCHSFANPLKLYSFNPHSVLRVLYLLVLVSQNKQRLYPYTRTVFVTETVVFTARYELRI
jgi:hypothetical protein